MFRFAMTGRQYSLCQDRQRTWFAVALLRHGHVADPFIVRVCPEVGSVGDVIEVLDAVLFGHGPATRIMLLLIAEAVQAQATHILAQTELEHEHHLHLSMSTFRLARSSSVKM